MTLSFWTNRPWQTVPTQIRLVLEDQSDQGLHCLPFYLHLLYKFPYGMTSLFEVGGDFSKYVGLLKYILTQTNLFSFDFRKAST